jgi:two-component system chemotaxis family response regulator WspR
MEPLSVLMIDIDDFKKFNDTYGHPQGDKLLRGLADILLGNTRQKIDLVARYGGEEFCIVLPATLATAAEATAERLRVNLADMERTAAQVAEDIRSSTEAQFFEGSLDSSGVRVTVSIGVACLPEHGTTAAELVGNADKALYLAKRAGKNRICVYSE